VPRQDPRFDELRGQLALDDYAVWRLTTPSTCATDGTLKLVLEGDEEWVYDLATDPDEVSPTHVDGRSAAQYGDRLAKLRTAVRSALPDEQQAMPPGEASQVAMAFGPADDAMAERMRLLGYL